jgi:predicted O-methyltransferase YrrM
MTERLYDICNKAMAEGRKIDLSGCCYGESHWQGPFCDHPMPHHYFIAGFVKTQNCLNMLDLGTHYGGSVMSMSRGSDRNDSKKRKIATCDITFKNEEGFQKYPHIKRFQGDSLSQDTIKKISAFFNGSVDLLFIDTDHKAQILWMNLQVYIKHLQPEYILIDDIHLNPSMEKAWKRIRVEFKEKAFDATDILDRKAGFGVVHCCYPLSLRVQPDLWIMHVISRMRHFVAKRVKRTIKNLS